MLLLLLLLLSGFDATAASAVVDVALTQAWLLPCLPFDRCTCIVIAIDNIARHTKALVCMIALARWLPWRVTTRKWSGAIFDAGAIRTIVSNLY